MILVRVEGAYFRCCLDKWQIPECICAVLQNLKQSDDKSPWVRTMYEQTLQKHPCDDLLDFEHVLIVVWRTEEVQQRIAEEMRVSVRVAKLIRNRTDEVELGLRIESRST